MHRQTASGRASVKDANPGWRGQWHRETRSLRGFHGVRSLRRRETTSILESQRDRPRDGIGGTNDHRGEERTCTLSWADEPRGDQ